MRLRQTFLRLHKNEGGNIIVLYVAASLLLVGMLWAVIGTGARMVQKETIQSSADAAAFSAAVIKAKGLNIIAFCNLVMALLLAIIMLLRLIKDALMLLMAMCAAACVASIFSFGATAFLCAFEPEATSLYNTYSRLEEQLEPRIMDAMKGIAKLERAVNKSFPALALVEAYRVGTHSSYARNFGKGTLVTIAWPLPVGKDLSLPTKDGTWDELCDQATKTFGRVLEIAMGKMGLGSAISSVFSSIVEGLLNPLKGILCGSGGGGGTYMMDTTEVRTSCDQCDGAIGSRYNGQRVVRNPDGTFNSFPPGVCKLSYFDPFMCPSGGSGFTTCDDGNEYRNLTFDACVVKVKKPADFGSALSDKPQPLDLADDWKSRVNTRAFTLLTDSNMAQRRQSVNVGVKTPGSAPMLNQLLGTAQAEFYAFNGDGHDDLWHMDWRARLVRFTIGDTSETSTGSAGSEGVPSDGASAISGKLNELLNSNEAGVLADQFMLH